MQFIDLKTQYQALKTEIDANMQSVLDSAQFIGGPFVMELEKQLAAFVGRKYCITCANGTDALQIAYMALDIGSGDAVFCPDITFVASAEPAKMLGAVPVFCDVEADTYNLSPASLERQIQAVLAKGGLTPKAVVAVDILGNPCDYDRIMNVCEKIRAVADRRRGAKFWRVVLRTPLRFFRNDCRNLVFSSETAGLLWRRRRDFSRR